MSSKQIAKLVFKGINMGVNYIPDKWWESVPGGYFKAKEREIDKMEDRKGHSTPHTRRLRRELRQEQREAGELSGTDSEDDYSSEDDDLSDAENGRQPPRDRGGRVRSKSLDRHHTHRHSRASTFPANPPSHGMHPGYYRQPQQQAPQQRQQQAPQQRQQPTSYPGQRPYNPAEYAMIPADGTTVQDPYTHYANEDGQSAYSTSNWVNSNHPTSPPPGNAVGPYTGDDARGMTPPMQSGTPPYQYGPSPYGYPPQYRASISGYLPHANVAGYDQAGNGAALARSSSARAPRQSSRAQSKRDRSVPAKAHSVTSSARADTQARSKDRRDKMATPALGALTGGLVASEVGGAGGLGALAGAAIGAVGVHLLEKRSRSKSQPASRPRDERKRDLEERKRDPDDLQPEMEQQALAEHEHRHSRNRQRREQERWAQHSRNPHGSHGYPEAQMDVPAY